MPYDLVNASNDRYRLPASITVEQRHVGGEPRARLVRAYGSTIVHRLQDGHREPAALNLTGILATDRLDNVLMTALAELRAAAAAAIWLVHVSPNDVDLERLPLLGSLPVTTAPDGVDSTNRQVTVPLLPATLEWEAL